MFAPIGAKKRKCLWNTPYFPGNIPEICPASISVSNSHHAAHSRRCKFQVIIILGFEPLLNCNFCSRALNGYPGSGHKFMTLALEVATGYCGGFLTKGSVKSPCLWGYHNKTMFRHWWDGSTLVQVTHHVHKEIQVKSSLGKSGTRREWSESWFGYRGSGGTIVTKAPMQNGAGPPSAKREKKIEENSTGRSDLGFRICQMKVRARSASENFGKYTTELRFSLQNFLLLGPSGAL